MKIILAILCSLTIFTVVAFALKTQNVLVIDAINLDQLPRNFRTTADNVATLGSTQGLFKLHTIGSAQFSELELQHVLDKYHPHLIIDLRQESHGFINGAAISWYGKYNWANTSLSDHDAQLVENQLLQSLQDQASVVARQIMSKNMGKIKQSQTIEFQAKQITSEVELLKKYSINYVRFYIADHKKPSDEQVDNFIGCIKHLPKDQWIYIHCRGGKGRTTIFMSMRDMMENAKHLSFEEIIKRQYYLGGQNLFKMPNKKEPTYKYAVQRLQFLSKFYDYCKSNQDNFATSWRSWLKNNYSLSLGG